MGFRGSLRSDFDNFLINYKKKKHTHTHTHLSGGPKGPPIPLQELEVGGDVGPRTF